MDLNTVTKVQSRLKSLMSEKLEQGDVQATIEIIDTFSDFTQRFNNIMRDSEIEGFLKEIAKRFIPISEATSKCDGKTIIFYDQVGTTICLGVQYLRALHDLGYSIIYIYECWVHDVSPQLLKIIKPWCSKIYTFNSRGDLFDAEKVFLGVKINRLINSINTNKILLHPASSGALGQSVLYSLKGYDIYRIVPGDHHFFIGYDYVKRFLEFRKFGISNAIYNRGLKPEQIVRLPYYPIIDNIGNFGGLPSQLEGKVIFMAAGATYKFIGSDIFLKFIDWILETPNTAFIFVGEAPAYFVNHAKQEKYKDRFFILGYRKDFIQIIQHIDVLICSYPFGGGLICQTAAYFEKPLLVYRKPEELEEYIVEDLLGDNGDDLSITDTSLDSFHKHINRLATSEEIRISEGKNAKKLLQTETAFTTGLDKVLKDDYPCVSGSVEPINFEYHKDNYLKIQNNYRASYFVPLLTRFGMTFFRKFSFLWREMLVNPKEVAKFTIYHYINEKRRRK